MTSIAERYSSRAETFTDKVAAVPSNAWSNQSPCPDWKAIDVVKHIVDSTVHFLAMVDRGDIEAPSADDDALAAWLAVRSAVETALADETVADMEIDGSMGKNTFAQLVDQYLSFDLVVHAWDLAKAAGIDDTLDPAAVSEAVAQAEKLAEMGRKMGAFGPEIDLRPAATEQDRLLAIVGRQSQA